jgi:cellulose-binding protein
VVRDERLSRPQTRRRHPADVAAPIVTVSRRSTILLALAIAGGISLQAAPRAVQPQSPVPALAARVDPYTPKVRVLVLTDIANEPDDQMSMVRLLVYSNQFDVEGLVATTSTWMRNKVRPDVIRSLIDAYALVQSNLSKHENGVPAAASLRDLVKAGQPGFGMAEVGTGKTSEGADAIIRAADRADERPLWITVWGGANTLAQALFHVRETRTAAQVSAFINKLRVYSISDQDDAGPWIRREFPALHYIAMPSTPDGDQYGYATWTGISGDRFYKNAPGADFTTFTDEWVNANIRSKGPLGKLYPFPCCIHEGDTPSFLGLINNGLASFMNPTFGGWGGRYVWRQFYGETRPSWTQGGDAFPGKDNSKDTVVGIDGKTYTTDQATIWRWRTAFQHDFAARMEWTIKDVGQANHNPDVVVNGQSGKAPIMLDARVGRALALDAAGTHDRDGNRLKYSWLFYPEAGSGIPGRPVAAGPAVPVGGGGTAAEGGIPSAPTGGPREPAARVTIDNASTARATVTPRVGGTVHVILVVEDDGGPSLTSYRRIILNIAAQ